VRFNALVAEKKVPAAVLANLPPAESYAHAVFPSLAHQNVTKTIVTRQWDSVVGANVK
jgi:putative spermidine/putrescine transport system substrate-binding protein